VGVEETLSQDVGVFRGVVDNSVDGVLIGMPSGRLLYTNQAACTVLGRSEDELRRLGRQGVTDEEDPLWQAALAERDRYGSTRSLLPVRRGDGHNCWLDVSSAIFAGRDGEPLSVWVIRDVTDRVRLDRRLLAYNEVIEALLAGAETTPILTIVARHARIIFEASDAAVLTVDKTPDAVEVTAADGPAISGLLGRRYEAGMEGSRVVATRQGVTVDDLSRTAPDEDGRGLGLGPAMLVPIFSAERVFGILFIGADPSRPVYTPEDLAGAETYAQRAGVALTLGLARAELERHQRDTVAQLQHALDSRVVIEQAKGVISGVRGIDVEEAFRRLRRHARDHHADIHSVAADVVARRLLI
jgi:PAS domain S-box-containing protein